MRALVLIALLALVLTGCGSGHYQGGFGQGLTQGYATGRGYPAYQIYQPPRRNCYTYPVGYGYSTYCY